MDNGKPPRAWTMEGGPKSEETEDGVGAEVVL